MADKRKAKGTKPTGQRKSATKRHNDSALRLPADIVADKENSHAVTSASERPRPRPIKKSTVPGNALRLAERSERDDEGASMAVEALLSIKNAKSSPATTSKARAGSIPTENEEAPESEDDLEIYCDGPGMENGLRVDDNSESNNIIVDQDDTIDVKSSDEDGMR